MHFFWCAPIVVHVHKFLGLAGSRGRELADGGDGQNVVWLTFSIVRVCLHCTVSRRLESVVYCVYIILACVCSYYYYYANETSARARAITFAKQKKTNSIGERRREKRRRRRPSTAKTMEKAFPKQFLILFWLAVFICILFRMSASLRWRCRCGFLWRARAPLRTEKERKKERIMHIKQTRRTRAGARIVAVSFGTIDFDFQTGFDYTPYAEGTGTHSLTHSHTHRPRANL